MAISIAIDFESKFITIYKKGMGIVLKEPVIAVVQSDRKGKLQLIASGKDAVKIIGDLNSEEKVLYPIVNGCVANPKVCHLMMQDFLYKVSSATLLKHKIIALVCVSCGLTVPERQNIEKTIIQAGASQVTIVESPIALYQLTNLDFALTFNMGSMLTEVAIVSADGIICGCSVDIALDAMANNVKEYVEAKYNTLLGATIAHRVLMSVGSMHPNDMSTIFVNGRDKEENMPKRIEITSADVRKAIKPSLDRFYEVIDSVMCSCPSNIMETVYNNGIVLAGEGMKIAGLGEYVASKVQMNPKIIDICDNALAMYDCDNAVATGGSVLMQYPQKLERVLSYK